MISLDCIDNFLMYININIWHFFINFNISHKTFFFFFKSMDLDMKQDCSQLVERINVFKTAFSENEDDER